MDIHHDTLDALDWAAILEALGTHARTPMGRAAIPELPLLTTLEPVREALDLTEEVISLEADGGWVPVGEVRDVRDELVRAHKGGVLTGDELRQVGKTLHGLDNLAEYLFTREKHVPRLEALAPPCRVDLDVRYTLEDAFDDLGQLSARAYPELGELRTRIQSLHQRIESTLQELVSGDTLADALQDRYITQRGDRYVVPIKANHKRKDMGIVHAVSGSGQTAFIEPHQVVALNNELRLAEAELDAAERRILAQLSAMVGRVAPGALEGLDAATIVDLAAARAGLAQALHATRPTVTTGGAVRLANARHPVLQLRGVEVVPNDLSLDAERPLLLVSGPNTGGKTIALKTLGLCALLVRIGCYLPVDEGSRMDLFDDVVALIGDHQTVLGDHSSFSSHVDALSQMLDRAKPGCLYLVDEIASGTDPQQGAALAHALLEAFVDKGVRGLVTTHFSRLKTLSALDDRFGIAALQFFQGQPTYRLVMGAHGDSHALAIAARLGVPDSLIARARDLLGEGERELTDLLSALDDERTRADAAAREAEAHAAELAELKARLSAKEAELTRRAREIEKKQAKAFVDRLARAEKAIGQVVADLQRQPTHQAVDAAKATVEAMRGLTPAVPEDEPELPAARTWSVGDRVKLRKLGNVGVIEAIKGETLTVRAGIVTVRVGIDEVDLPGAASAPPPKKKKKQPKPPSDRPKDTQLALDSALRHASNTCDLRGKRVDEGLEEVDAFLDKALMRGMDVVFVLHGHGTGAMKKAVRDWLRSAPHVAKWTPANPDQGGDAYTVAALK